MENILKHKLALANASKYSRSLDVDREDGKVVNSKKNGGIKVRVNPSFRSHLTSVQSDQSPCEENRKPDFENLIDL